MSSSTPRRPGGDAQPPDDDPRRWPVRREVSAGGVVVRRGTAAWECALVRPASTAGKVAWALPKGIVEAGERAEDAAVREVLEETGLTADIVGPLDDVNYWYTWAPDRVRVKKTVHLFLMRWTGGQPTPQEGEIDEVAFVAMDRAPRVATYSSERTALRAAAAAVAAW